MNDDKPNIPAEMIWRTKHLRVIQLFLAIFVLAMGARLIYSRGFIDDPQPDIPARADDLADQLDPNTATWQELAAISGLGEKKAHAITEYRDKWIAKHPATLAFTGPQDLRNIKGIGPATVSNLSPFLIFPKDKKPAKAPS